MAQRPCRYRIYPAAPVAVSQRRFRRIIRQSLGKPHHLRRSITYTEAIDLLQKAVDKGRKFEFPVQWGASLQAEHEKHLTEEVFKKPVIVRDYPREKKAFYMRVNDDGTTVAAMDCLVPGIGELIGGSQRQLCRRHGVLQPAH